MRKLLFTFFLLGCSFAFGQGLILDATEYSNARQWEPKEEQGYTSGVLPSRVSYRSYTPYIQNQGKLGTCVGWAVAYAQLSTQQNIEMGITNPTQKVCRAMDPYFVFGNIRNYGDTWCQAGTRIYDAMAVLMAKGTKPWIWDPWLTCNSKVTFSEFTNALASNYVISDYFAVPHDDLVRNVKEALSYKLIVSVGVNLTESFQSGSTATYGVWSPSANEQSIGGHAMCVVGYDDNKFGGAFEVMNSWGSDYGDNGFVWIKYPDFKKYVAEAYVIDAGDYKAENCSKGDCYNSYSRYKFSNGDIYEGLIVNGYPDIYGSTVFPNGNFYVGGMNKGRKHGSGIIYDAAQRVYFNVVFNNDNYVRWSVKQGYASDEESEKMTKLLEILNTMSAARTVDPESEEQDAYFEKMDIPEDPLVIPNEK
jgi:hypothetical protein